MKQTATCIVKGVVQGVGFRYSARELANTHDLTGYVENLDDGSVKIICEGEHDAIDKFLIDVKNSVFPIVVKDINVNRSANVGKYVTFAIKAGDLASEMVEGFGVGSAYLKHLVVGQDQMLDKQDQTIHEIRNLSSNMHEMIDSRFEKLESEISKIKTRLEI